MKGIYENDIEVNNDLKLNGDEQQDEIKHLKEQNIRLKITKKTLLL